MYKLSFHNTIKHRLNAYINPFPNLLVLMIWKLIKNQLKERGPQHISSRIEIRPSFSTAGYNLTGRDNGLLVRLLGVIVGDLLQH